MRGCPRSWNGVAPLDHVDLTLRTVPGISAEDLRAVARRYFSADNYVYAAVRGAAAGK